MTSPDQPPSLFETIDLRLNDRTFSEVKVDPDVGHVVIVDYGPLTFLLFLDGSTVDDGDTATGRLALEVRGYSAQDPVGSVHYIEIERHELSAP